MRKIGFSTGALAFGEFKKGLELIRNAGLRAVELSALREPELEPLIRALDSLDLSDFDYVSVHAPSAIREDNEKKTVELLQNVAERNWSIIVHPDVIQDVSLWRSLGEALCIENNDRRKIVGQSCQDMLSWFERLPSAGFCLDLGHARQVDSTMTEAYIMLRHLKDRLRQLHVSEVTSNSKHTRLTYLTVRAFKDIARYIPSEITAIIESVVPESEIRLEVRSVRRALTGDTSGPARTTSTSTAPPAV